MKLFSVLVAVIVAGLTSAGARAASPPANAPTVASACMDHAQTQADMDQCAAVDAHAADLELNRVYQQVLKKYASDAAFIAKLKVAQRAWLTYRDAELAARFPATDKSTYGSIYPMCVDNEMESLTRERIEVLRKWLVGTPEGDACAVSYQGVQTGK